MAEDWVRLELGMLLQIGLLRYTKYYYFCLMMIGKAGRLYISGEEVANRRDQDKKSNGLKDLTKD